MEFINSIDQYGALALRTLATDVGADPLKVTMNAMSGLCSETGEFIELMVSTKHDRTHMMKELGDWMWYWSLMCHSYGLKNSEVMLTDDVDRAYFAIQEMMVSKSAVTLALDFPVIVGAIAEFTKKHWFHHHPADLEVIKKHLHTALYLWFRAIWHYQLQPSEVLGLNIDKLRKRYPEGFSTEKSINRAPGDI